MKKIILLVALFVSLFSCTKDQGPIEPEIVITTVSFAADVQPIFELNCTTSCHNESNENYNGGLNLEVNFSYTELVDVVSEAYSPEKRVIADEPENSVLWQKINNSLLFGVNMPMGSSALSQQDQDIIKVWIEEGALDN